MFSTVKPLTFLLTFCCLFALGCQKDNAGPAGCAANFNYAMELQDEATALGNAANAYGQNPTTENCNAYKAAYRTYLDAAAAIELCVPAADQAAYNAAVQDARESLDALQC